MGPAIGYFLDGYPLAAPPWRDIVFGALPGAGALDWPAVVEAVGAVFGPATA